MRPGSRGVVAGCRRLAAVAGHLVVAVTRAQHAEAYLTLAVLSRLP